MSPAGEAEISDWLRELNVEPVKEYTHFEAGLCLLPALPPGEAIDLLKRREQRLLNDFRQLRAELDRALGQGIPPLFLVEHEYRLNRMDGERQFVLALLRRIEEEGWAMSPGWNHFQGVYPEPEPEGDKKQTRPKIRQRKPVS